VLNPGVTLLPKPFTPSALAKRLRAVLYQPAAPKPKEALMNQTRTDEFPMGRTPDGKTAGLPHSC